MPLRRRPAAPSAEETPRSFTPGVVTRLVRQQRDAQRVSVYLDGAFAFGLHEDVVMREGVRNGLALTAEAQAALVAADEAMRARRKAMDLLAHRGRSRAELARALRETGFAETAIEDAVARLVELGYVDDDALAQAYVQGRFRVRGYGPGRLRQDLRQRGLPPEAIDGALDTLSADALREVALRHAFRAWQRHADEPDRRKRRKKVYDFLCRRGFDFELAAALAEEVAATPDAPADEDAQSGW